MSCRVPLAVVALLLALFLPVSSASASVAVAPPDSVVVQPGDTLWALSRRYGTTVAELQRLNSLGASTLIRIGQTLVVADTRARKVALAVAYAEAQVGKPYRFDTEGPDTFDCSGLVMRAWEAAGVDLPRVTYEQIKVGTRITRAALRAGDLVFTNNGGHVVLYIGNNEIINAGHTGVSVSRQRLMAEAKVVAYVRVAGELDSLRR
ncbi:LysM peptidoglycan-binding domain-containing C40 family peptidase [Dactylosporangium sp. AC04546]|uniref:C40 family peptidase n=1 Tax=Dactylosporangium sp. AC04546 TaxID=2862460 RepID=UPI001EDC9C7C|nr:LysM peptidoglycan-binding domain-containing C40 family peptidase [Dactylosporangium sp. AC04546]WVK78290.1 LysM peptidoglycan-binding domain-containing C40 family peptidase [Dactylosporangium sp. AC04546]